MIFPLMEKTYMGCVRKSEVSTYMWHGFNLEKSEVNQQKYGGADGKTRFVFKKM